MDDSFDLTCCQVGVEGVGGKVVGTYAGLRDLMRREFRIERNVWPTTAARARKYQERGFKQIGKIPALRLSR